MKKDGYPLNEAITLAQDNKLGIGIFYEERRKTYQEQLPQLSKEPLVKQSIADIEIGELVKEFIWI